MKVSAAVLFFIRDMAEKIVRELILSTPASIAKEDSASHW